MTAADHEDRLKAMTEPGQQTWDLSTKDEAAIAWALAELARLRADLDAAVGANVYEYDPRRWFFVCAADTSGVGPYGSEAEARAAYLAVARLEAAAAKEGGKP